MSPFRKKIDSMRGTSLPAPDKSMEDETETETEGDSLESVEAETDMLLDKADSAGVLTVLEPFVEQSGCTDTKHLLKKAQTVPELKGKTPAEVASMLGADKTLIEKLKDKVGGRSKSEPMEPMGMKETEPTYGSPKERFGAKIMSMRGSAEE
tara:strand:+ start:302 stop:757 length:456 start_codon:yes stop_codon:yes gene_type:complete